MPRYEFPAGGLGGVELGRADDVDTGVLQFISIERRYRGQLPRTIWSPGRPKYQKRRGAIGVSQVEHRPVQGLSLERDAFRAFTAAGRGRSGPRGIGRQRPRCVGGRRRRNSGGHRRVCRRRRLRRPRGSSGLRRRWLGGRCGRQQRLNGGRVLSICPIRRGGTASNEGDAGTDRENQGQFANSWHGRSVAGSTGNQNPGLGRGDAPSTPGQYSRIGFRCKRQYSSRVRSGRGAADAAVSPDRSVGGSLRAMKTKQGEITFAPTGRTADALQRHCSAIGSP